MDKKVRLQITDVIDSVSANPEMINVFFGSTYRSCWARATWMPPFYYKTYSVVTAQQAFLYPGAYDIGSTSIPSNRCKLCSWSLLLK